MRQTYGARRGLLVVVLGSLIAGLLVACSGTAHHSSGLLPDATVGATTTTAPAAAVATPAAPDCGNPVASIAPSNPNPLGMMPANSFMEKIQKRGRLIAAVDPSTQQFSARNPFTGQLEGFDIDMLHWVAKAILGDPNKIEYHVVNYAQRIPSLLDGSVDVVADVMTINCRRWAQIDFSSEYFHAGQRVLVRTDSTLASIQQMAIAHTKVCAANGSTNIDNLKNYPGVQIVAVDDLTACLVLFQEGTIGAITGDDTVLAGFAVQDPYAKIVGAAFTDEPYGLGIAKGHPDFVQFVNNVIEQLRTDGTWKAMYAKWIQTKGQTAIPEPPKAVYGRPSEPVKP